MPAHLTLLLLLVNPLAGGDAAELASAGPNLPTLPALIGAPVPNAAAQADSLRDEFEALRARHERALESFALAPALPPGAANPVDQAYRSSFQELSERGSTRATAWFLRAFPLANRASRPELSARLGLFEHLVREAADRAWLLDPTFDVFGVLRRDAAVLGRGPAIDLAEAFARASSVDETRAAALGTAALIEARWTEADPARRARARGRHAEVLRRFPATAQAAVSKDALWRLSNLAVGKTAPGFITRDVDGNEIRLTDLHRRVLVVEFWGETDAGIRTWAAHRRALVERHLDDRFFVLGVNLDLDSKRFRRSLEALEVEWLNAFDGGLAKRNVWRMDRTGTNVVLDVNGVVRFVNIHGAELDAAVASLIAELGAPGALGSQSQQNQGGAAQGL